MKQSILRDTCMITGGDGKNYLLLFPDPPGSMQVSLKKECFSFNGDPYFRFPFSGFRFPFSVFRFSVSVFRFPVIP